MQDNSPKALISRWVEAFNRGDVNALALCYAEDAVNHQVAQAPVRGRAAIAAMFAREFATADMTCIVENLFADGEWAMLEWRDPAGLRGCGFFHVRDGRIQLQRGYWDKLSFLRQQGLPIPGGHAGDAGAAPPAPGPSQRIGLVTLVVANYDEAIDFYAGRLGFELLEDTRLPGQDKRWVVVAPPGGNGSGLLLARASTAAQAACIGRQAGGRVGLFLHTDDFDRDYARYRANGVRFLREPRQEAYGQVAVFEDLYGNPWDLLAPGRKDA